MRKPVNILITGIGSTTAISIIKGLKKQKKYAIRIIGVDIHRQNEIAGSSFCDSYYQIPDALSKQYVNTLIEIIEKEKIQILFPVIDIELLVIAQNIRFFKNKKVTIWLSDYETINICNDKYLTCSFFKKNNIPTPKFWLPNKLNKNYQSLKFPLIIKPRNGVSSRDVYKINNCEELDKYVSIVKNSVIQMYIEGTEYTIDVLSDSESNVLSVVPRERIETRAGISYKGKVVANTKLERYGREIAQLLKIKGPCNIQCIIDTSGNLFFIEINPRFSGSLPLTIASGINGPYILTNITLGDRVERKDLIFKKDVYMIRYWEEVFY